MFLLILLQSTPMKLHSSFYLYCACLAGIGLIVSSLGPALPTLAQTAGTSLAGISFLLVLRSLGHMAGSLSGGHLYDRLPGHPVMALAVLVGAAALALSGQVSSFLSLGILIFIIGTAVGFLDVGANTLMPWRFGEQAKPLINGLHFCFGLGALSAPFVVAISLSRGAGVQTAFAILALALLPLAWWLFRSPSPSHREENTHAKPVPILWNVALPVMALFFFYGGSEAAFGSWVYSYAREMNLASIEEAGAITSLFWSCLAVGRLIAIPLLKRFEAVWVMGSDLILCLCALGLIVLMPHSLAALWIGAAMLGLGFASFIPTLITAAGGAMTGSNRASGKSTALMFLGAGLGNLSLPWMTGQALGLWGPQSAMQVLLLCVIILGGVYAWYLLAIRKPKV